ncbi:MAG: SdpI family protein [Eubacteriales bacterium]|jgi:uncharacterized membrane protein
MNFWAVMLFFDMLIPLAMIIFGRLLLKKPPEKRNCFFGYRTYRSMLSDETWFYANSYCGRLWYIYGWVMMPVSVIILLPFIDSTDTTISVIGLIEVIFQLAAMSLTIFLTDKKLRQTFDEKGDRKE